MMPAFMTTETAATEMGVATSTIRTWVERGWLRVAAKAGGKSYYWRSDVLKAERRARRGEVVADAS